MGVADDDVDGAFEDMITSRTIQAGVRGGCVGELIKHAVSEGTKAVTKFTAADNVDAVPRAPRAGLQFSVEVTGALAAHETSMSLSEGAAVYLAAVLEYHAAEILELGGNAARDNQCECMTNRHV